MVHALCTDTQRHNLTCLSIEYLQCLPCSGTAKNNSNCNKKERYKADTLTLLDVMPYLDAQTVNFPQKNLTRSTHLKGYFLFNIINDEFVFYVLSITSKTYINIFGPLY